MQRLMPRQDELRVIRFIGKINRDTITRSQLLRDKTVVDFLKEVSIRSIELPGDPEELSEAQKVLLIRLLRQALEHAKYMAIFVSERMKGSDNIDKAYSELMDHASKAELWIDENKTPWIRKAVVETIKTPEDADNLIRRIELIL